MINSDILPEIDAPIKDEMSFVNDSSIGLENEELFHSNENLSEDDSELVENIIHSNSQQEMINELISQQNDRGLNVSDHSIDVRSDIDGDGLRDRVIDFSIDTDNDSIPDDIIPADNDGDGIRNDELNEFLD